MERCLEEWVRRLLAGLAFFLRWHRKSASVMMPWSRMPGAHLAMQGEDEEKNGG